MKCAYARIVARALEIFSANYEHRMVEQVVRIILVQSGCHRFRLPQSSTPAAGKACQ